MRRFITSLLGLSFLLSFSPAKADEGMWLLSLLKNQNIAKMHQMGLKLTAQDIYSVNNSSVKDAIVGMGRDGRPFSHFCSGEVISDQGLFLTNHHCGFSAIQSHSTPAHDYLKDGFWAYSKEEELANPGITASILVRMEDVSDQIIPQLNEEMTDKQRYETINKLATEIEKKAEEGTDYKTNVKSMFNGNQYFLFVYIIYRDVRLVGAPPQSMGKFGGDTDNWIWPRHTADFSMFRIYTGPDGKPAPYSKDNIPLKPKHHLPISIKGAQQNDFAMIMGFPGGTDRFLTSYGLNETMKITNANRYKIRTVKLDNMRKEMEKSAKVRIQYASKYAGCANYWKYSNEQNKALKHLNTMGQKLAIEKQFTHWVNASDERKAKYSQALKMIEQSYKERKTEAFAITYLGEALLSGPELPDFAIFCTRLQKELEKGKKADHEKIKEMVEGLKKQADKFYKDFDPKTEENLIANLFQLFAQNVDAENTPDVFVTIAKKFKNDFNKYARTFMDKSVFASKGKFMAFLENPSPKVLKKDMAFVAGNSILKTYRKVAQSYRKKSKDMSKGMRLFVAGLMEMNPNKTWAPDANSTLRLTYGKVGGYSPKDAVSYNFFTTLKGVMEKEDPSNFEFVVPAKLKDLYKSKDFGQYADAQGRLHTCFLTNHDITGGNSGSPVINANGELIGTAFDGNSEAMSGDIDFEENLQRCINLDVRYTLFIIDKFAGATNLIDEMTIVK